MKDYLQKILICIVQNFIEFIKIGSVYIAINFAFRLSLIMIVFTSIYEQIHYAILAIFYGLFFDIIIIYIFAIPLIIYRIFASSKFFIYNIIFYLVSLAIIAQCGLDLFVFSVNKNRIHNYLPDLIYYKKIFPDLIEFFLAEYSFILFACGGIIFAFCITIYIAKWFKKIKFNNKPSISMKALIALIFLIIFHIIFVKFSNIKIENKCNNRYVQMLSNNLILEFLKPIFHKKNNDIIAEKLFIYSEKNKRNIMLFFIEGLSTKTIDQMPHLKKIANKSISFSNAISTNKNLFNEISAIFNSGPFFDKQYNALFFNNLTPAKSKFFADFLSRYGFKYKQDNLIKHINNKSFVFASILNIKTADEDIHHILQSSIEKDWFQNTVFIFVGMSDKTYGSKIADIDYYKTPVIFYSPAFFSHSVVKNWVSTIDIMPSVADLLGISYKANSKGESLFLGHSRRAFITENDVLSSINTYEQKYYFK